MVVRSLDSSETSQFLNSFISLDHKHFAYPWKINNWQSLDWEQHQVYIALDEEAQLLGFALFKLNRLEGISHLLKILVYPEYRRQNIGKSILAQAFEDLPKMDLDRIFLEVESTNEPAVELYRSQGFRELNLVPAFYSDGKSAFTMEKTYTASHKI